MTLRTNVPKALKSGRIARVDLDMTRLGSDLEVADRFTYNEPYDEFVCGRWQSCMLWNGTANADDSRIADHNVPARKTKFGEHLPYLTNFISNTFDCNQLRFVRLARVLPGTALVPHRDYLELRRALRRIHVPLATDANSLMSEGELVYRMRVGEVWFLDATQLHSAASFSDKYRLHMILDFCDGDDLQTAIRIPCDEPDIPMESIVVRPNMTPAEEKSIRELSRIIDMDNYRDILSLLIKKQFRWNCHAESVFMWLSEIAFESKDRDLCERIKRDHEYFAKVRSNVNT